jgi:hypothetical protein
MAAKPRASLVVDFTIFQQPELEENINTTNFSKQYIMLSTLNDDVSSSSGPQGRRTGKIPTSFLAKESSRSSGTRGREAQKHGSPGQGVAHHEIWEAVVVIPSSWTLEEDAAVADVEWLAFRLREVVEGEAGGGSESVGSRSVGVGRLDGFEP